MYDKEIKAKRYVSKPPVVALKISPQTLIRAHAPAASTATRRKDMYQKKIKKKTETKVNKCHIFQHQQTQQHTTTPKTYMMEKQHTIPPRPLKYS